MDWLFLKFRLIKINFITQPYFINKITTFIIKNEQKICFLPEKKYKKSIYLNKTPLCLSLALSLSFLNIDLIQAW